VEANFYDNVFVILAAVFQSSFYDLLIILN